MFTHDSYWILANKQLCEGALEQFQSKATWTTVDEDPSLSTSKLSVLPPTAKLTLSLWGTKSLHIGESFDLKEYLELDSRDCPWSKIHLQAQNLRVVRALKAHDTYLNLRYLSFGLEPYSLYKETSEGVKMDLRPLTQLSLPKLQSVDIKLWLQARFRDDGLLEKSVRQGVEDMGMARLGENARVEFKVDIEVEDTRYYHFKRV